MIGYQDFSKFLINSQIFYDFGGFSRQIDRQTDMKKYHKNALWVKFAGVKFPTFFKKTGA